MTTNLTTTVSKGNITASFSRMVVVGVSQGFVTVNRPLRVFILCEDSGYILLENGGKILQES